MEAHLSHLWTIRHYLLPEGEEVEVFQSTETWTAIPGKLGKMEQGTAAHRGLEVGKQIQEYYLGLELACGAMVKVWLGRHAASEVAAKVSKHSAH